MKDITAFYKNQLIEVTKSITKNQITDIPRHQRSTNMEQPINNAYMNQPLNVCMNQHKNQHYQLNCHQQSPTLPTTNNQRSYQSQQTQPQQQYNPPQNHDNHTILPEHSTSTLLKEPGLKKKLKSCKKIRRGKKQKQIYRNMSFFMLILTD